MENFLTKRNIVIAGVAVVIVIAVLVFLGRKSGSEESGGGGGFLERLFPFGSESTGDSSKTPSSSTLGVDGLQTPSVLSDAELPLTSEAAKNLPVGTLLRLSDSVVSSLAPRLQSVRYHKNIPENLGHLFERKADGTSEEARISNFTIPQVLKVVWAPDAVRSVIFYKTGDQIRKILVDYASTSTPRTNFLPDSISDVVFSPDSKSLAFLNDLDATQNLFVATSDFKNPRKVLDNNVRGLEIAWPSANTIALKTKSSYLATGFLYAVDVKTGGLTKIADGLGLDAVWNSDSSGALYSSVNSAGKLLPLKFIDLKSQKITEIPLNTIAEKCVFLKTLKQVAYCAAPQNPSLKLPDEWWKGKISFIDAFAAIDTEKGEAASFIATSLDATNPKLLPDESFLMFQDKSTGNLWSIKLKP